MLFPNFFPPLSNKQCGHRLTKFMQILIYLTMTHPGMRTVAQPSITHAQVDGVTCSTGHNIYHVYFEFRNHLAGGYI